MKYTPHQYAEALYEALHEKKGKERALVLERFMDLIRKNHQEKQLQLVLNHYEKVFLNKQGMRKVDIESTSALSPEVKKEIEKSIGGAVMLTETVNPDLVAGLTILIDDALFIDASARTQIRNLF